jgi:adenosylhomocysteinase
MVRACHRYNHQLNGATMSKSAKATSSIANSALASAGRKRTQWATGEMPVLTQLRAEFSATKPLKGHRLAACLHVTTETANLMITLQAAGCELSLCASNPLSTQDDAAAHLARDYGISVHAIHGASNKAYYSHINAALDLKPSIAMDDGCDLVALFIPARAELLPHVRGEPKRPQQA